MVCSPERLAANRINSKKSCGPRTAEGKAASSRNAIKHGLTGACLALTPEDAEAVGRRLAGFEAELRPVGEASRFLVRQAAALSVRIERCMAQEAAATARRVARASAELDRAKADEADRLMAAIADDPAGARRRLLATPEGLDRLIAGLDEIRSGFERARWDPAKADRLDHLMGRSPAGWGVSREHALSEAFLGRLDLLRDDEGEGLDEDDRRRWAAGELWRAIDREVADLTDRRAAMGDDPDADDRAGAPAVALFDPSPESALARRYEADAGRAFHKALDRLAALKDAGPDPAPAGPTDEGAETSGELASSCAGPDPAPPAPPDRPRSDRPAAPNRPAAPPEVAPVAPGRLAGPPG